MNIIRLAIANIKHGRSATFSLFIIIFIATLLLNTGLTFLTQMNTFYDKRVSELNDSHVSVIMKSGAYKPSYEEYLRSYNGVDQFEKSSLMMLNAITFLYSNNDLNVGAVLMNADETRSFSPVTYIEKLEDQSNTDIYLPYGFKVNGGYKLGDAFSLTYQNNKHQFRVAGFFEATMLGMHNTGIIKFQFPESVYHALVTKLGHETDGLMLSVILDESEQATNLLNEYNRQFPQMVTGISASEIWGIDVQTVKTVSMMTIQIIFIIIVAFALIMVLVSLIVIKFRVSNSIEDGMINIGILKSAGYTSWQLISSMLLQFGIVTLLGGLLGVAVSYAVMPFFGSIITTLSGLVWIQHLNVVINAISVLIVIVLVMAVTLVTASRIRKLPVVAALRGGIHTHSFRRNYVPLDKSRGGLQFLLASKSMLSSGKQNIMLILILAAVSFASVYSVILYYNISGKNQSFIHLIGVETSNVMVWLKPEADEVKIAEELKKDSKVAKIVPFDMIAPQIDGQSFYMNISDDFSHLNNNTTFEGRYPKYDNEVSLSWLVAEQLNKGIGDTVEVKVGNHSDHYLVTGLSQSMNNMGQLSDMTMSGVQRIIPDYRALAYHIYLEDIDNTSFISSFKTKYGGQVNDVLDIDENIESQSAIYISAVFTVMLVILATTALVVVIILYLVIKTLIVKRKKEFGVMKAMGYTTLQLMNQIAMSFLPVVITGVMIGFTLGSLFTNNILSVLLSSMGVRQVHFVVHVPLLLLLSISIVALAYVIAMLLSRRIKAISVYSLITE